MPKCTGQLGLCTWVSRWQSGRANWSSSASDIWPEPVNTTVSYLASKDRLEEVKSRPGVTRGFVLAQAELVVCKADLASDRNWPAGGVQLTAASGGRSLENCHRAISDRCL